MAPPKRSSRSSLAGEALYEAVEAFLLAYQARDRDRPCYGDISISECHGLDLIVRQGPVPVNEVASALHVDKSGASRIARSLERKGYVRRRKNSRDLRSVMLASTAAGKKRARRLRAQVVARQESALEGMSPALRKALPEALRRLAESAARPPVRK